jgi:hypothetical protein
MTFFSCHSVVWQWFAFGVALFSRKSRRKCCQKHLDGLQSLELLFGLGVCVFPPYSCSLQCRSKVINPFHQQWQCDWGTLGTEEGVDGIFGCTQHSSTWVPRPWGNIECWPLLSSGMAPVGRHPTKHSDLLTESSPSQQHLYQYSPCHNACNLRSSFTWSVLPTHRSGWTLPLTNPTSSDR